jgi:hypothetical protein
MLRRISIISALAVAVVATPIAAHAALLKTPNSADALGLLLAGLLKGVFGGAV